MKMKAHTVPLYFVIYSDLLQKIQRGELRPGDRLPNEVDMQAIYKASRAPVRQALAKLEKEGLVTRIPGKGTFIRFRDELRHWFSFGGFGISFARDWGNIRCRTMSLSRERVPVDIAQCLGVPVGSSVLLIRRIRTVKKVPVFYLKHYFPVEYDEEVFREAGDFFSLRSIMMEHFGVESVSVEEEISAVNADQDIASALAVPETTAVLQILRRTFDRYSQLVTLDQYYVQSNMWRYFVAFHA